MFGFAGHHHKEFVSSTDTNDVCQNKTTMRPVSIHILTFTYLHPVHKNVFNRLALCIFYP